MELYPAESRLMDEANQYHMFVFPPGDPLPIGHKERIVQTPEETSAETGGRAVQRPFAAHHNADGLAEVGPVWAFKDDPKNEWGKERRHE